MKKLLLILLFAAGSVFASNEYAMPDASEGGSLQVTRSQAKNMGLNKADYYVVYSTEDMARLDDQIAKRLKYRTPAYYSVVYIVPRSDDNNYQAIVTEYFAKVK